MTDKRLLGRDKDIEDFRVRLIAAIEELSLMDPGDVTKVLKHLFGVFEPLINHEMIALMKGGVVSDGNGLQEWQIEEICDAATDLAEEELALKEGLRNSGNSDLNRLESHLLHQRLVGVVENTIRKLVQEQKKNA